MTHPPDFEGTEPGPAAASRSEPVFNLPRAVLGTIIVMVLVHALRMLVLSDAEDLRLLLTFAFIPARYSSHVPDGVLPGGFGADLWTFFTYAFLHADLRHLGLNMAWLVPFGTAIARRFGPWRYCVFMLVMAAIGAFTQLACHPGEMEPMIGASAAISGAMGAAMRFILDARGPLALFRRADDRAYRVPAAPLLTIVRDTRFLIFLAVWLGLNLLYWLGTASFVGPGQEIAWQAHIGGFFAGLLLFPFFDPAAPSQNEDAGKPTG